MQGFRFTIHLAAVGAALGTLLTAPAVAAESADPALTGASRVIVTLKDDPQRQYPYAGLTDAAGSVSYWNPGIELDEVQVLDYATYGSGQERLIPASRAFFLLNAARAKDPDAQHIIAFSSRSAAKKAQRQLGGDLRDFTDAWKVAGEYWNKPTMHKATRPAAQPLRRPARNAPPANCYT